ncbi:hypothetical protein AB3S75_000311 [Citrus x aurantiifolia]
MLVEEMGVAVELTRGVQSTIVGHEVKNVIEMVMDKAGKGQEMKEKAEKIGRQIRASMTEDGDDRGSSLEGLDDFIRSILLRRQDQSV